MVLLVLLVVLPPPSLPLTVVAVGLSWWLRVSLSCLRVHCVIIGRVGVFVVPRARVQLCVAVDLAVGVVKVCSPLSSSVVERPFCSPL